MALRVEMTGNATGFKRMLEEAKVQTKALAASIKEEVNQSFIGGFKGLASGFLGFEALGKIREAFSWFQETGTQIKDISDQLGMSTDQWQKWADAVDDANLSVEGLVRVIESLKQKRTEALTDPKARAALTQLGFTDADISGNMSTSDFVTKAFQNANMNQWASQAFENIVGAQGLRYTRALSHLPNATADFSPQDLKDATTLHDLEHNIQKNVVDATKRGFVRSLLHPGWLDMLGAQGFLAKWAINAWLPKESAVLGAGGVDTGTTNAPAPASSGTASSANDPLKLVLAQQSQEFAFRDQEREQRVKDSERELMTIGDRFKSIRQEMEPLQQQIAQREAAIKSPEGFLTDAQKQSLSGISGIARTIQVNELRQKYLDQTADLQMRYLKDKADLRQGPLNFQADNLAKVGLYSANALAFNPALGIGVAREQLTVLKTIAQNTAKPAVQPPHDPHRP